MCIDVWLYTKVLMVQDLGDGPFEGMDKNLPEVYHVELVFVLCDISNKTNNLNFESYLNAFEGRDAHVEKDSIQDWHRNKL